MKLVIFERDWADEFSPYGFAIMTEEEFEKFKEHYSKPQTWYFGTNEGFEKENEDILFDDCTVKDITQEEADSIIKLFDLKSYIWCWGHEAGLFPRKPDEDDDDDEDL